MVLAINSACSLLNAKSCTPRCVVNESTMMSGWFSGQPVVKAVTKSAEVARFVMGDVLYQNVWVGADRNEDAGGELPPCGPSAAGQAPGTKAVTSISTLARASTRPPM